jgi:hypothetical protein
MNTNTKAPEAGSGSATKALEPQPIRLTYSVDEARRLLGIGRSLAYQMAERGNACQASASWAAGTLSRKPGARCLAGNTEQG